MALATKCPHCQTTFKVAQDQLKLRSGLVRCGTCKQVFNGIEHLVSPDTQIPAPAPPPAKPVEANTPANQIPAVPTPAATTPAPPTPVLTANAKIDTAAKPVVDFVSLDEPPLDFPKITAPLKPSVLPPADKTDSTPPIPPVSAALPAAKPAPATQIPPTLPEAPTARSETVVAPPVSPPISTQQNVPPKPLSQILPEEAAPEAETEPIPSPKPEQEAQPEISVDKKDSAPPLPPPVIAAVENEPEVKPVPEPEPELPHDSVTETAAPDDAEELSLAEADAEQETTVSQIGDEEEIDEPDFVIRSRKRQRRSRMVRIFMACASVVLLVVLGLQGAFAFRNQLAAWFPQSKPMLAQLCTVAGCQVKLPAQIEMVTIESNELQTLAADKHTFVLSLLLRNHSQVTQAWPYIELTLNDTNENALARRVLLPRDYLAPTQDSSKGFTANSEQSVKLNFELPQIKASGYRVYLFYP